MVLVSAVVGKKLIRMETNPSVLYLLNIRDASRGFYGLVKIRIYVKGEFKYST